HVHLFLGQFGGCPPTELVIPHAAAGACPESDSRESHRYVGCYAPDVFVPVLDPHFSAELKGELAFGTDVLGSIDDHSFSGRQENILRERSDAEDVGLASKEPHSLSVKAPPR